MEKVTIAKREFKEVTLLERNEYNKDDAYYS